MEAKMSLKARKELLVRIKGKYQKADWQDKTKILDAFVEASGYRRKYAISLLNETEEATEIRKTEIRQRQKIYDDEVKQAFLAVWRAANEICPKRLVPFLPKFVEALEKHGHLSLAPSTRERLLKVSAATADRFLPVDRRENKRRGISTTRAGTLLKKQIPIRTFADWSDVTPGFVEADLVAHCGDRASGIFLNTLTLTDIATGWTECVPLLRRSEADVRSALENIRSVLPFPLLGLDTDNGSEFINHQLLRFCETECITFTRARAYRKNDQAHVEEKNGSVVRRMIGYDRFEGLGAWRVLAALYAKLRLYVNFFQPSQKLLQKRRIGSKTTKQYDKASTPNERLLASAHISLAAKNALRKTFEDLDPVTLLNQIKLLQAELSEHSWTKPEAVSAPDLVAETIAQIYQLEEPRAMRQSARKFHRGKKPRKQMSPRTHRTRKDDFETVWGDIQRRLEIDPNRTAKDLLSELISEHPGKFNVNQRRTLQRRVLEWRQRMLALEAKHLRITLGPDTTIQIFNELTNLALTQ
jgi:hypothetical protein